MAIFDASLLLNEKREIISVLEDSTGMFDGSILGQPASEVFDFSEEEEIFTYRAAIYEYQTVAMPGEGSVLLAAAFEHTAAYYQKVLDCVDESVICLDRKGNFVYVNRTGERVNGYLSEDVAGKHLCAVCDIAEDESTTLKVLRTKHAYRNLYHRYATIYGKELSILHSEFPISVRENEPLGVASFENNFEMLQRKKTWLNQVISTMEKQSPADISRKTAQSYTFDDIIGETPKIRDTIELAKRIAPLNSSVLVTGETGTGKEMFAQSIHAASYRSKGKFVAINCAAIPDTLIESLLFGTERGSFTGSVDKAGLFEEADNGTLFLDEINSMSLNMQSKLLRVLETSTLRRVGGHKDIRVNVRTIAACNADVFELIKKGVFRRDLYYRIAAISIDIPPLHQRSEDIPLYIDFFFKHHQEGRIFSLDHISPTVLSILMEYEWPGNVRELFHVLEYAVNVATTNTLDNSCLPRYILEQRSGAEDSTLTPCTGKWDDRTLQESIGEYESHIIKMALKHYGGNVSQTAKALGLQRQGLQYRMRKYGIWN